MSLANTLLLEKTLLKLFDYEHAIITGSGTSAIYSIIKSLGINKKKIILPAISCSYPLYAIWLTNNEPILCDVNLNTGCIDYLNLKELLEETKNVGAVIGIHIYGNRIKRHQELIEYLSKKGIVYIDDFAQAIGASLLVSNRANFSVLSFGRDKIIEAGHGGAILTNNSEVASKIRKLQGKLNTAITNVLSTKKKIRDYYYCLFDNRKLNIEEKQSLLNKTIWRNRGAFLYRYDHNYSESINSLIQRMHFEFDKRKNIAFLYRQVFCEDGRFADIMDHETIPWRYSIRLKGSNYHTNLRTIFNLRNKGYVLSNLYPSLDHICLHKGINKLSSSKTIEDEIYNFPVNKEFTPKMIRNLISAFLHEIEAD